MDHVIFWHRFVIASVVVYTCIWYHLTVVPQLIWVNITNLITSVLCKCNRRIIWIKVHLLAPNSSKVHFWHPNSKTRFATSNYEIRPFFSPSGGFASDIGWCGCHVSTTSLPCHSHVTVFLLLIFSTNVSSISGIFLEAFYLNEWWSLFFRLFSVVVFVLFMGSGIVDSGMHVTKDYLWDQPRVKSRRFQ